MQAILNVKLSEINNDFLKTIKDLLSKNMEVVIRKEVVRLEEYDASIPLDKVIQEFAEVGYSQEFLRDLKEGLKTSTVYAKK